MVTFIFTKHGKRVFRQLSPEIQERILDKLKELKKHPNIKSILGVLHNIPPATHKLRIGNYRLLLALGKEEKNSIEFLVLKIGHRKDIYRL